MNASVALAPSSRLQKSPPNRQSEGRTMLRVLDSGASNTESVFEGTIVLESRERFKHKLNVHSL